MAASTVRAPHSVSFRHNQSEIGINVDLESRETRPAFVKATFYTVNTFPGIPTISGPPLQFNLQKRKTLLSAKIILELLHVRTRKVEPFDAAGSQV